ncbi:hypothetical protein RRG08_056890 [Elysia crispata]|uniref:Uncharacterized protein n=1 Tax=Elysia crispata TaxID=231223 RepID=A0AAE0ZCC8_9GAST|nr:hypothetical protein RRG08_056890 [Elysia crispata]
MKPSPYLSGDYQLAIASDCVRHATVIFGHTVPVKLPKSVLKQTDWCGQGKLGAHLLHQRQHPTTRTSSDGDDDDDVVARDDVATVNGNKPRRRILSGLVPSVAALIDRARFAGSILEPGLSNTIYVTIDYLLSDKPEQGRCNHLQLSSTTKTTTTTALSGRHAKRDVRGASTGLAVRRGPGCVYRITPQAGILTLSILSTFSRTSTQSILTSERRGGAYRPARPQQGPGRSPIFREDFTTVFTYQMNLGKTLKSSQADNVEPSEKQARLSATLNRPDYARQSDGAPDTLHYRC